MERFPWHPRLRHAGIARRLVIAARLADAGGRGRGGDGRDVGHTERLSDRQEHEAGPDREHHAARADADRGVRRADRTGQRGDADLHAEGACREHLQPRRHRRERLRDPRCRTTSSRSPTRSSPGTTATRRWSFVVTRTSRERRAAAADALHPRDEAGWRTHLPVSRHDGSSQSPSRANPVPCARPRPTHLAARPSRGLDGASRRAEEACSNALALPGRRL